MGSANRREQGPRYRDEVQRGSELIAAQPQSKPIVWLAFSGEVKCASWRAEPDRPQEQPMDSRKAQQNRSAGKPEGQGAISALHGPLPSTRFGKAK